MILVFIITSFTKAIFSFFLNILGYKKEKFLTIPKFVIIAAPHTSLLDFWNMLNGRLILDVNQYTLYETILPINGYWLAKKILFKWSLEYSIKTLRALRVNRSKFKKTVLELS